MQAQPGGVGSPDRGQGRRPQHLTPTTIKQLINAPSGDDVLRIDGREAYYVKVVGLILRVAKGASSSTYALDDGTGSIDCRIYIEAGDAAGGGYNAAPGAGAAAWLREQQEQWQEYTYVSVIGYMKSFGEKRVLQASRIRSVTDHNEITFHLLDAAHAHLVNSRGLAAPAYSNYQQDYQQQQYGGNTGYEAMAAEPTYATAAPTGGSLQESLLNLLRKADVAGVHVSTIISQLQSIATEADIRNTLENLLSEGFVYNTTSEEMFKNT